MASAPRPTREHSHPFQIKPDRDWNRSKQLAANLCLSSDRSSECCPLRRARTMPCTGILRRHDQSALQIHERSRAGSIIVGPFQTTALSQTNDRVLGSRRARRPRHPKCGPTPHAPTSLARGDRVESEAREPSRLLIWKGSLEQTRNCGLDRPESSPISTFPKTPRGHRGTALVSSASIHSMEASRCS